MKKILIMVIVILMLALSACQPTDVLQQTTEAVDSIPATTETSEVIDTSETTPSPAPITTPGESLQEQYDIPKTYTYIAQGADGELTVEVDADIIVPDVNCMPMYQVTAREFSQEMAYKLFNAFRGDTEMYDYTNQQTKEIVLKKIEWLKGRINALEEDSLDWKAAVEGLEYFEELLPNAPEERDEERADGTIGELKYSKNVGFEAYERYEDGMNGWGKFISVINGVKDGSLTYTYYSDFKMPAAEPFWAPFLIEKYDSVLIIDDSDVDEEDISKTGIKPSEAKQMVKDFLDENDIELKPERVYLQCDKKGKYYTYKVACVKTVDGLDTAYVTSDGAEQAVIRVNGDGIVSVAWINPIEVGEVLEPVTQLMPFSEIADVFEDMIITKYETLISSTGNSVDICIDTITLSLQQVSTGYGSAMAPVWNFYGTSTVENDGEGSKSGETMLSINAMDGRVIDLYVY